MIWSPQANILLFFRLLCRFFRQLGVLYCENKQLVLLKKYGKLKCQTI